MSSCVRLATAEDIYRWFGGPPPVSMKAIVLEMDGRLEGIAGVQSINGSLTCFSTLNEAARKDKRRVVEGVRLLRKMLQGHRNVIAYATKDEPTADAFIRHVGFRYAGSSAAGEVYIYE